MHESSYSVGSLVRCRGREWVVLPSDEAEVVKLRPLIGGEDEICGVYLPLGLDEIEPAKFPLPSPERSGDFESCKLLWNAARFNLRSGAGPFRCMGRLSVRPRPYQVVPLLMALRLDPIRILIADDVGIGKTIEAALIARELLDRGEERRLAVLCPPYLCDQWQAELKDKFHIDAVVIRSGTVGRLDRMLPGGDVSVFDYFPHIIVSIDYAKMPRRRDIFLQGCPRLVIVDEAHSSSLPRGRKAGSPRHQRYELLRDLAAAEDRHIILLTATPHSGIEESFRSLLGFLKPSLGGRGDASRSALPDDSGLGELDPKVLAPHFIQRKRADVEKWLGESSPFPSRRSEERVYWLSEPYRKLFNDVYDFAREMVQTGEDITSYRRRVRYWAALSLLRCVTSSPAAAEAALARKIEHEKRDLFDVTSSDEHANFDNGGRGDGGSGVDTDESHGRSLRNAVLDPSPEDDEVVEDIPQGRIIEEALEKRGLRKLREFAKRAESLKGNKDDKMKVAAGVVGELLGDGYHPIVYCRFIATSDYVAGELDRLLRPAFPELRVISVTSSLTDDERRIRIRELTESECYVLVATDCLSEGINLQEGFDAVVHYDLPWNPNRLEQREGRVDRFGQSRPEVRTVLIHGKDNPIDGAVLDVLIRKAVEIRRRLGISVPVPLSSESVVEAVLHALLFKGRVGRQMELFVGGRISTESFYQMWDEEAERYEKVRRQYAHEHIKPDEVCEALQETDAVLGDKKAVQEFIISVCKRLDAVVEKKGCWEIDVNKLPGFVKGRLLEAREFGMLYGEMESKGFPGAAGAGSENMPGGRRRATGRALGRGVGSAAEKAGGKRKHRASGLPSGRGGAPAGGKPKRRADNGFMRICFDYPPGEGAQVVGRNHPLTNALAEYVFESALEASVAGYERSAGEGVFSSARCGAIITDAVAGKTIIVLLRVRYEITPKGSAPSFAEECLVCGFREASSGDKDENIFELMVKDEVLHVLNNAKPRANMDRGRKKMVLEEALKTIGGVDQDLSAYVEIRARSLKEAHIRVRRVVNRESVNVKPVKPLDILGVYVLVPG